MSAIDSARRPDSDTFLKALIEEAKRRARRRRRVYGAAVVAFAVIAAIVFATLRGPPSFRSSSPATLAAPGGPVARVGTDPPRVPHGLFSCTGKRGNFTVAVAFPGSGKRFWDVVSGPQMSPMDLGTGQYAYLRGGGRHVEAGEHGSAWYARLVGFVGPRGKPRQRVVIQLRGRPTGTCAFAPTQARVFKRDSGTQTSEWFR